MSAFKFFRHKNGISSFAAISVDLVDGPLGSVSWADALASLESIYGDAVKNGVIDALQWHAAQGRGPGAFHVSDFTELMMDTKPDAARCAATGAAWKALGHDETELIFELDGEWKAELRTLRLELRPT